MQRIESELELLEMRQQVPCPLTNERHGNSILNNEQQVFTRWDTQKILRKITEKLWNVGRIGHFEVIDQGNE